MIILQSIIALFILILSLLMYFSGSDHERFFGEKNSRNFLRKIGPVLLGLLGLIWFIYEIYSSAILDIEPQDDEILERVAFIVFLGTFLLLAFGSLLSFSREVFYHRLNGPPQGRKLPIVLQNRPLVGWHQLSRIFSGTMGRISFLLPFFGYLVLFNDTTATLISFDFIIGNEALDLEVQRRNLYCIYFGMLSISIATIAFHVFCPGFIKDLRNEFDFIRLYSGILSEQWLDFFHSQAIKGGFVDDEENGNRIRNLKNSIKNKPLDEVIRQHSSFLSDFLMMAHQGLNKGRRISKFTCVIFLAFGLSLLSIPSADLLIRVGQSSVNEGFWSGLFSLAPL